MAEDRAALVARLRELEQTCKAQADAYEGDYRAWLERAEAVHHAIAALSTPPAPPREAQQGWEDIDGENAAYVNRVTSVVREADRSFEQVGGSLRHWVRDCFLPMLNRAGLRMIQPAPDVTCQHGVAMDVHCCNCHNGFIFDADHECPSREAPREPREAVRVLDAMEREQEPATAKKPEHVCGLSGFWQESYEHGDRCPACEANNRARGEG